MPRTTQVCQKRSDRRPDELSVHTDAVPMPALLPKVVSGLTSSACPRVGERVLADRAFSLEGNALFIAPSPNRFCLSDFLVFLSF